MKKKSLPLTINTLGLTVLLTGSAVALSAQDVFFDFNGETDLPDNFTYTANATVGLDGGVGDSGSVVPNSASYSFGDGSAPALNTPSFDLTDAEVRTISLDFFFVGNDSSSNIARFSIGFADEVDAGAVNQNFGVQFQATTTAVDSVLLRTQGEGSSVQNSEITIPLDEWYRVEADFFLAGADLFQIDARLLSIGADGMADPVLLDSLTATLATTDLISDTELFAGFNLQRSYTIASGEPLFGFSNFDNFSVVTGGGDDPMTYGGYDIVVNGNGEQWIDTASFMGWLNVDLAPWLYSQTLDTYIYLPEDFLSDETGSWTYILR